MPLTHSIVLGIVQGLTEFLPVSSSAHLELVAWFFGWEDFGGDAAREQAFDVALHVGTLVGAAYFLRRDIVRYARAVLGEALALLGRRGAAGPSKQDETGAGKRGAAEAGDQTARAKQRGDARVGLALALSAIPAAIVAVVLESPLLTLGEEILVIAVALVLGGWLLWWVDRVAGRRSSRAAERQVGNLTLQQAAWLGIAQACALVPGVSRSGATLAAGRLLRFDRSSAARISFLMSLPVIAGAGIFRGLGLVGEGVPAQDWTAMAVGLVTAAITAWFALWVIMHLLAPPPGTEVGAAGAGGAAAAGSAARIPIGHRLFTSTAIYRTALAICAAVVLFAGWR